MPQPPFTLFPWLHLFFLGPWSPSTQNLTPVFSLSLHPAILQQGQSCLLVPAKSAETGCASQTQAAPPQWLSRRYPLPSHWADWSTSLSWVPHSQMLSAAFLMAPCVLFILGPGIVNTSTCIWLSWAKQTGVGHRSRNHWLTHWSPLKPNAVLPSTTAICVKSSEDVATRRDHAREAMR